MNDWRGVLKSGHLAASRRTVLEVCDFGNGSHAALIQAESISVIPTIRMSRPVTTDRGFGMIEIVVSMFLIAILALAALPILVTSMKLTATNVVITRATQVVSAQLDLARKQGELSPTCSALQGLTTVSPIAIADTGAEPLRYTRTVGGCPATYPGTVPVDATVTLVSTGAVLSTARTLVVVSSLN